MVESIRYDDSYGTITERQRIVETNNPYCYTGRELDTDELYYYRARYYDPGAQCFISEDPIGFLSGDVNFYRYNRNDPLNFTDPLGLIRRRRGGGKCGWRTRQSRRQRLRFAKGKKPPTGFLRWAKNSRRVYRVAVAAELATPEPSDVLWPKYVGELVTEIAFDLTIGALNNGYLAPEELAKLNALEAECNKKKQIKSKKDAKVEKKKKSKKKCSRARKNKGNCAERLVDKKYEMHNFEIFDTSKITNGSGHGHDNIAIMGNTAIITETKANNASLSKLQREGGYANHLRQDKAYKNGLDNVGNMKSVDNKEINKYFKTMKGKDMEYRTCRVKLVNDKSNCYGKNGRGICQATSIKCSKWEAK